MKYITFFAIITISYIFSVAFFEQAHRKIVQSNDNTIDSLIGEISTLQIDKGRYEVILDRIRSVDSNLVDNAMRNVE